MLFSKEAGDRSSKLRLRLEYRFETGVAALGPRFVLEEADLSGRFFHCVLLVGVGGYGQIYFLLLYFFVRLPHVGILFFKLELCSLDGLRSRKRIRHRVLFDAAAGRARTDSRHGVFDVRGHF